MNAALLHLQVRNYRSLADVNVAFHGINVLFGPNGAGKSSLLDVLWFLRDCKLRGVDEASAFRDHGVGLRWSGADPDEPIFIALETGDGRYEVEFVLASGRIDPFVGELLYDKARKIRLIDRKSGANVAQFHHTRLQQSDTIELREPEKLTLDRYLDYSPDPPRAGVQINQLLQRAHLYDSLAFERYRLKRQGSETSHQTWLFDRAQNLWSVLANVHGRRALDPRYETIIGFMRESFPAFQDLIFDQTGPGSIYGSFVLKGLREPVAASGIANGYLQLLILLTALFAEGQEREALLMFDEPDTSLHPHALAVFARAVQRAVDDWNRQVILVTHSPVLMSQFEPENVLALGLDTYGHTTIQRVTEIESIHDLLDEYAVGSLYMAEAVAPQGIAV